MAIKLHFINVGQGNMVLLNLLDCGQNIIYDCNITQENEWSVLNYVAQNLGSGRSIDLFINSHRDADHMRGINRLHNTFPIRRVWDNGHPGNNSIDYQRYMAVRRSCGHAVVKSRTYQDFGNTRLRILSGNDETLPQNGNCQSIVVKVLNKLAGEDCSVILTGDSDTSTWKRIRQSYGRNDLNARILMSSHHGSLTFFDDPYDERYYYLDHITDIAPHMAVLSVGPNTYGHPHVNSLDFYERFSRGCSAGKKILRTDHHGNIRISLNDDGRVLYDVDHP